MTKNYLFTLLCIVLSFSSCENEQIFNEYHDEIINAELNKVLNEAVIGDSIIEITNKNIQRTPKVRTYSYGEDTGIDGIVGMPVNLVIKQNPFGKRYITYKGENMECKLEDASNSSNQKFFLKRMPLTGLFYFTPEDKPSYLLSSGIYPSNPNVHVLYVKSSTSSTGATWDITKGNADNKSFVLYNEDLLEQGSGGWMDVYNLALGVNTNNGNINFSKYNKQRTQEFEIRPCDDFVITEMQLSQYGNSNVIDLPDFVIKEVYNNNGSVQQQMSTKITKRAQNSSNFNRKTSLTTNVTSSVKVGAFFVDSKITMSVGASQDWTYGESETINDDREYNFPLVIAPYKRVEVSIFVSRKQANINYRAKMRGINTGYEIWEEGTWENVDCTNIVVNLDEYDIRTNLKTGSRKLNGIPTTPTGVH